MDKVITGARLQARIDEVLDEVVRGRYSYLLVRDEQPEAVLIGYDHFLRLLKLSPERDRVSRDLDELHSRLAEQNAGFSEEEIEADIEVARQEVAEARARAQAARA